jgi:hypothetical protein
VEALAGTPHRPYRRRTAAGTVHPSLEARIDMELPDETLA